MFERLRKTEAILDGIDTGHVLSSPKVRVEYTPDRGRHLRAGRALQIGEVLF